MSKRIMKELKEKKMKGITLIALVITMNSKKW